MDSQLRHDIINNCLRLEILNKLIAQALESKQIPDTEYIEDLRKYLDLQKDLIKDL